MKRFLIFFICVFCFATSAHAVDFMQKYEKGKLLLKQKYYFDAIKEFHRAINLTSRGRTHFGAHYYLAKAYYWLPDIKKAMEALKEAKKFIKNKAQKRALKKILAQIGMLYSSVEVSPEVDPEDVGKLQLTVKVKGVFSHKHKTRYFKLFEKRLKKSGGLKLDGSTMYLPKGDYILKIKKPQCLKYAVTYMNAIVGEVSIEDKKVSLSLKELPSCKCTGGQKRIKEGKKVFCACPSGTGWNKDKQRCEVVKRKKWVIPVSVVVGAVVVGGVATGVYFATRDPGGPKINLNNKDNPGTTKVW